MLRLRPSSSLVLAALVTAACVDPHWHSVSWPAQAPNTPAQPRTHAAALGLELAALAMTWESESIGVSLELHNTAETPLLVDSNAILVAWDGLEYPPTGATQATNLNLEPGARSVVELRYQLGRPLTARGARLVLRSLEREGVKLRAVPALELPAGE